MANEYFDSFSSPPPRPPYNDSTSHLPQDSYMTTAVNKPLPSPHGYASPEPYSHRPWALQLGVSQTSSYTTPGTPADPSAYADDVPLRPNPSKQSSDVVIQNHLPDDPAVLDRPPQQNAKRLRDGWFSGRIPWVVYILSTIQVSVFIAELAKNGALTGSPIEVHPNFNPMIGPSPYILINMGARYVPCMRETDATLNSSIVWPCPNTTSTTLSDPSAACHLNNLCGFGDGAYTATHMPHQWFRFIIPIFLHAGFIHIGFNLLLQLLLGRDIEREIGSLRFFFVYFSSGIFGFVLGGNFAPEGIASTGASGGLFGIIALTLLDLLYHWQERRSPWIDLTWIIVDVAISFVLGLLPGLDNFSHIGGFLMGLVLGVCILHSPDILQRRVGDLPPYSSVVADSSPTTPGAPPVTNGAVYREFTKAPIGFFKGRKPLWWAWWFVRVAAFLGVLIGFIVLLKNFWSANPMQCHWCRYLSCIDIKNWCDIGQLTYTSSTSPSGSAPTSAAASTSPAKRELARLVLHQLRQLQ